MTKQHLFTVGYEGRTVTEFVAALKQAGVCRVVDVRQLPLSRRKGFSKTKLAEALNTADIQYVHLREAGNPYRDLRDDLDRCLQLYGAYIDGHPDVIDQLEQLTAGTRTALLCFEANPHACHRSVLVKRIRARGCPLEVKHL